MFPRGRVLFLSAAAVFACATLVGGVARRPVAQTAPGSSLDAALKEGRTDEALAALAEQAVADAEQAGDQQGLALAFEQLGQVRAARGEFGRARQAQSRALTYWSDSGDAGNAARLLEQLAESQLRDAAFSDAAATLVRLRAIREPVQSSQTVEFAELLRLEATLRTRNGDYPVARRLLDQALALADRGTWNPNRLAPLLLISGDVAYFQGDFPRAATEYDAALSAARRAVGDMHPSITEYLLKVAYGRSAFAEMQQARDLRLRAVDLAESRLPACHPTSLAARSDLAISEMYFGNYAGTRELWEASLAASRACLGNTHSVTATLLVNLGWILLQLGDLPAAEALEREAVAAWTANRGAAHVFVAIPIENLAEVLAAQGRLAESLVEYERAIQLRSAAVGDSHPAVARLFVARAAVLEQQRKLPAALRELAHASAIYARTPGVEDLEAIEAKTRLELLRGRIEHRLGRVADARMAYAAAVAAREALLGSSHPLVAQARTLVAAVDAQLGARREAFQEALATEAMIRDHLRQTIRYLPDRQALEYAGLKPQSLDLAVALAVSGGEDRMRAAVDAVIRSRGLVLDELAGRAQLARDADVVTPDVTRRFAAAQQRYANLLVQTLREPVPRARLDAARREAESLETQLAAEATARADRTRTDAGLEEIMSGLPSDAALIGYLRYEPPAVGAQASAPRYAGFVIASRTSAPLLVDIGTAPAIERLVSGWRAQASVRPGVATVSGAGEALRRAVWDPLAKHAGSASRIFIVSDGALSLVNFAALPRPGSGYLVEDARLLHYLSVERDLLSVASADSRRSALIVGGPTFESARPTAVAALRTATDCRGARPLSFRDLPAARAEAAEVSTLLMQRGVGDTTLLRGAEATETAVKRAMNGRRVVHLATHGFFLGSGCEPARSGTRAVGGVVAASAPRATRNPLRLAGLAFAGVGRQHPDGTDDGILTAEEIASLDLRGTEWAVLSACDTGLGEIRSGEGVLGLRRAFQIAGARTVIMSLWSVEDQATRRWMQALYDARLTHDLDTASAMRAASLTVLAQRRAAGLSTHPFYWAAFVAAGDWR
jgi:CHAT domain-containing protein